MNSKTRLSRTAALCGLFLLALLPPIPAAEFAEYRVKAEFIERLVQFVEWPEGAFSGPKAPFVIAIAGEDPFGRYLEDMARARTIKGRPVLLRHVQPGGPPGACHLLFISGGEYARLPELLAAAGRGVLTIGDGEKFARNGAHVGLYRRSGRLRFEINLETARKSGLVLSSKLMRSAAAVHGGGVI